LFSIHRNAIPTWASRPIVVSFTTFLPLLGTLGAVQFLPSPCPRSFRGQLSPLPLFSVPKHLSRIEVFRFLFLLGSTPPGHRRSFSFSPGSSRPSPFLLSSRALTSNAQFRSSLSCNPSVSCFAPSQWLAVPFPSRSQELMLAYCVRPLSSDPHRLAEVSFRFSSLSPLFRA